MMQFLLDKGLFEEVLYHGSSFEIMQMYLEQACKYMYEHYRLRLFYKRPFTWMDMPFERATRVIAKYLTAPNTASIIRFENKDCGDHWSIIRAVPFPLSRFKLFDSYLYPHLDTGSCRWEKGKNAVMYRARGLFLLKSHPKSRISCQMILTKTDL